MTHSPSPTEIAAAVLFAVAVLHTLAASRIHALAHRYPRHAGSLHLLGEVEVVFGFWAIVLVCVMALLQGGERAMQYAQSRQYTEPLFVFVVMVVAATRPILATVDRLLSAVARAAPIPAPAARAWLALAVVPLLGSLVTEPAAMTIGALILGPQIFRPEVPARVKYLVLGVLFVNISIGGTLTSFAAPPVLMVADAWGWTSAFMAATFGWKAAIAVVVNASIAVVVARTHLVPRVTEVDGTPASVVLVHCLFLAGVVALSHYPVAFIALFLMFVGFTQAYERHQSPLVVREALLVAFFLAGLVVLGGLQAWWLQPLVSSLSAWQLFAGATLLTAVTDNAALTYLGTLIEGLPAESRYSLVAGAVAGGGLTVIANAPNPAGVALLRRGFDDESIGVLGLLAGAALPTLIAVAALAFL